MVLDIVTTGGVLIIQYFVFWFIGHFYCRVLLWTNQNMVSVAKWGVAAIIYVGLAALIVVIPLVGLWCLETISINAMDRVWFYGIGLSANSIAMIISARKYKDQMVRAGYWK